MIRVPNALAGLAMAAVAATAAGAAEIVETTMGPAEIHPINHASFVLNWHDTTVFVDPVGGAEEYAEFERPKLVLLTHHHGDHLDLETLRGVVGETTELVAPASVVEKLEGLKAGRITTLAAGENCERLGVDITAIPAYNLHSERLHFHPKGRDNGYVLDLGGTRLYISGDTEDIPEMRALEDIDAAFVCMNLPYTMDVDQAAGAVLEFAPKVVYPYHYRGTEGLSDLERFKKLVSADPDIAVKVLDWY